MPTDTKDRASGAASNTPVPKSLIARVVAGLRFAATGDTSWMSPMSPAPPVAPKSAAGRLWDYPVGYNINTQPRTGEPIGFATMRSLADNYDLLRIIIEGRKDQIAKFNWSIKPKDKEKEADDRCKQVQDFFMSPDKIHTWDDWLRMIIEDMLVIDAPSIYVRKTNGGQLFALEPMDGATIAVLIDSMGRRPAAPAPAYAQYIKGPNAVQYTTEELIYKPRNPRTHKAYGFSPVEQIIMTVHMALRRQLSQFEYFESGTLPDAVAGMPDGWTTDQIAEFQKYFDNLLSDAATKRKVRYMPKDTAATFKEVKAPPLKDLFDEWIARITCYAFSVEVTPFVAQVNRSVADTNREQALQEGLVPLQRWVKSLVDTVISQHMGFDDLEFQWDEEEDIDPKAQAEIDKIYIECGVMSVPFVQKRLGIDKDIGETEPVTEEPELGPDGKPIVKPVDPNAPVVPGAAGAGAAGPNVQATALNGTQITSLMALVQSVVDEALPLESARAMIQASFPMLDEKQIDAMLTPTVGFEKKPEPVMGGVDADGNPLPPAPTEGDGGDAAEEDAKAVPPAKKPVKAVAKMGGYYGDVHVHVTLPDTIVDVAGTTVQVNMDGVTKTATVRPDEET
jgi:hypothetical protein